VSFEYKIQTNAWIYEISATHPSDVDKLLYADVHIRNLNQQDHPDAEGLIQGLVAAIEAIPDLTVVSVGRSKPQLEVFP
jgi:hypothetical protein